ncbi:MULTISPECIES: hypothetical protein [Streptomyces]|uniref:hypothetical protein n=1 Tax=Streptomyces TaxID=1883 RepID=UPI0035DEAFDC
MNGILAHADQPPFDRTWAVHAGEPPPGRPRGPSFRLTPYEVSVCQAVGSSPGVP